MGYAANGFCFDTPDAAAAYACGHDYPVMSSMVDGTGHPASVVIECTASTGNSLTLQRDVNGAVDGVSTLALTSPACDETEYLTYHPFSLSATDGALIGAAIVSTWLVGFGWRAVIRTLNSRSPSSASEEE